MRTRELHDRPLGLPVGLIDRRETERLIAGHKKGRANGARLLALVMLSASYANLGIIVRSRLCCARNEGNRNWPVRVRTVEVFRQGHRERELICSD